MSNVPSISKNARIAGTWRHADGYSEVEFTFAVQDGEVKVAVVDRSDGEVPEVYGIEWSERDLVLRFAVHWSTGRFVKYSVSVGPSPNRVEATITSTTQETWERK